LFLFELDADDVGEQGEGTEDLSDEKGWAGHDEK
jgi:hypothetical protein